jgi:hypothetical protein
VKALVVNCSTQFNLGAAKLANWLEGEGWQVDRARGDPGMFTLGYDLVALSVMFSWNAPMARDIAVRVRDRAEVWAGGPGLFALKSWWKRETGFEPHIGLDHRFEYQRGDYLMTFASRGCPVDCWFCIVPKLEGTTFTLNWWFQPAPILCDNNLSALPVDFQDHVIARYEQAEMVLRDANSGFEPLTFDGDTYERWRSILRGPWRFALDDMTELEQVHRMMEVLCDVARKRKRVYVLIGNEPMEACYERALKVLEWGGEPFCQPFIPLNSLNGVPKARFDWSVQTLRDFARYYNRYLWKYVPIWDYSNRKDEQAPLRSLRTGG